MHGFPFSRRPVGWFQVGWSADFPVGACRPLRYFGRELVCYRGASGALTLLDAFCPHLGAHLGHGGSVEGDAVRCPFHGWVWDSDGSNLEIPGATRSNGARRLRSWPIVENCGMALMWHGPEGVEPTWRVDPVVDDPAAFFAPFPEGSRCWRLRIQPQVVVENGVDCAHFTFLHRAAEPPVITSMQADGPVMRITQDMVFGGGKPSSWLTPDGPVRAGLLEENWGVGLSFVRFAGTDDAVTCVAVTPVDDEWSDFRMTNWVPREPDDDGEAYSEHAKRRVAEQFKQARRDFVVWENMTYVDRPPLTRTEAAPFRALRAWCQQFYAADLDLEAPAGALERQG